MRSGRDQPSADVARVANERPLDPGVLRREAPSGSYVQGHWEVGSQIHWMRFAPRSVPYAFPWQPTGVLTGSGRDALRLVLQDQRWRRLWVPSYLCQEIVRSLQHCGVELACFADSPLEAAPDLGRLPLREGDAILVVNYFGLRRRQDVSVPAGIGVIEDHTHAPFSSWARASRADYCVSSLRKILPLPDGGVVWSPAGHPLPAAPSVGAELAAAAHARLEAMLLKALYLDGHAVDKQSFLDLTAAGEARFARGPASGMTALSAALLRTLPIESWEQRRRVNFGQLADVLSELRGCRLLLPRAGDEAPFCAALVFDEARQRDLLRAQLIARDVYPSALWPLESPLLEGVPAAHRELSRRMFVLPCDARYDADDVDRMTTVLREEGLATAHAGFAVTIPKEPRCRTCFVGARAFTRTARAGLEHLLRHACPPERGILLPAYVGWSPREGSGLVDPIEACGLQHSFYRVEATLEADLVDLERRLRRLHPFAVVVIHYFGFPQRETLRIRKLCHEHGAILIEDCAHTLDSRLDGRAVGTIGDASVFSIHKVLPARDGGILQVNGGSLRLPPLDPAVEGGADALRAFAGADLAVIAERRRSNFVQLLERVRCVPNVTPLFAGIDEGTTPLNLPLLVEGRDRAGVYRHLRRAGIGAVALYHTLVAGIGADEYPISADLSRRVLNLPIHQDVEPAELETIAEALDRAVNG